MGVINNTSSSSMPASQNTRPLLSIPHFGQDGGGGKKEQKEVRQELVILLMDAAAGGEGHIIRIVVLIYLT